ncbi:hypothetical protein GC163_00975 [bacterium]|nr:hypothetical protein [bacterium]
MTNLTEQLSEFNQFAAKRLTSSAPPASLNDIIEEWYAQNYAEADRVAIEQSLLDFQNGERGRDAAEFLAEFHKHRTHS